MRKKNSFYSQTIILQCLWIFIGTIISIIINRLLGIIIVGNIDKEKDLNYLFEIYFKYSNYIFIIFGSLLILIGCFIIQKKQMEKYSNYFESALNYLSGETSEIIPFHESLSTQREKYISIKKKYSNMERDYEEVYREKTDLLTYLAHDIKTPISNILGYASILNEERDLKERQRQKFVKVIYENTKILNSLTEDFFAYLKFNLNEIPINIKKFNIELFFKQWEEELHVLDIANTLNVKLEDLENKEVQTDPELLLRVLDNLFSNAVKYSKKESNIDIIVKNKADKIIITMINEVDNDSNIDWDMVKAKFYRGDFARHIKSIEGFGLGLTIVNEIVSYLEGSFDIQEIKEKVYAKVTIPVVMKK